MAVSGLTKFSVPTTDSPPNSGLLMPKLSYRFRVSFINFGTTVANSELTKQVIDFKRPTVEFGENVIEVYNSKLYLQGKPTWSETEVKFRDDASGEVSRLIAEQIQKQFDFLEQSSAPQGTDYKFQMKLEVLDGSNGASPTVLETWEMFGCYIKNSDYGSHDYSSSDPVTISLNIRFDNAIQNINEGSEEAAPAV